jgi:TonB family protein
MSMTELPVHLEVFNAREIARAAGVELNDVGALLASGRVSMIGGSFVAARDAVEVVRSLRMGTTLLTPEPNLFQRPAADGRKPGLPIAASTAVHVLLATTVALMLGAGPAAPRVMSRIDPANLIFLTTPGPGGGGGGGGSRQPTPPARAELAGPSRMRSPVATRRAAAPRKPEPMAAPKPEPQAEPPHAEAAPPKEREIETPTVAPVATVAADARDRTGLPTPAADVSASAGRGNGGGAGSGAGGGLGEGQGPGVGPGSGGGTGGGPYRPGSGIAPPSVLHEVKPDYTEAARQRGVNGDVELEIVVRSDGTVGSVRLLRGLGFGLDQRAIDAVRQWRFSPATRFGTPVDVLVEVAVEFKLR